MAERGLGTNPSKMTGAPSLSEVIMASLLRMVHVTRRTPSLLQTICTAALCLSSNRYDTKSGCPTELKHSSVKIRIGLRSCRLEENSPTAGHG